MSHLSAFASFARNSAKPVKKNAAKIAVVYTRVSGKEQYDKNLSLDTQRKAIEQYARNNGIVIVERFGGTYESAKTDGRKEFTRMLDYIKKSRGVVTHILVFMLDRFSRTGGGAIKLAEDLREQYGVDIHAVMQPADTSMPSGVLQQNIHFIFSQYDNQIRRQRVISGMKEKFSRGEWVVQPPLGYDIVKSDGVRKIVVNAKGRKLKKAFEWKAQGLKNEDILQRLKAMGLPLYKQHLTKLLKNPFYCGLICHGLLEGKIVEGTHEKLISQELFLRVNNIGKKASGYGVPHCKEHDEVPLRVFVQCGDCGEPFTGYVVKAKNLWYYKCRKKGCRCNRSAKEMHRLFKELLEQYCLKPELYDLVRRQMAIIWKDINKETVEQQKAYREQLAGIEKKMETLEERYYVNREMSREIFDKFYNRLSAEQLEVQRQMGQPGENISNAAEVIDKAIGLASKLATAWASGGYKEKEALQKLVFPEGIVYDRENRAFRTKRVNSIFALIASLAGDPVKSKKGQTDDLHRLSPLADWTGLEPATSAVTGRHSNQLNYQSVCYSLLGMQR